MRNRLFLVVSTACLLLSSAHSAAPPPRADLAAFIQKAVVARMPRQFEDLSEWGATIPITAVRFPRLKRTTIKVGDHLEWPHGTWKRTKVWILDPARDLQIRIPRSRKVGANTTQLRVEATVALQAERERKQWAKGIHIVGVTAGADAVVTVGLDIDVTVGFNLARPLDGVKVDAQVKQVALELKEFNLRRLGPVLLPEQNRLGDELKAKIQERLKTLEPRIKEQANRAIAEGVKDGKGLLPRGDR